MEKYQALLMPVHIEVSVWVVDCSGLELEDVLVGDRFESNQGIHGQVS